nr:invasion associated locus B family protein [Bradyrhizobium sp. G127]
MRAFLTLAFACAALPAIGEYTTPWEKQCAQAKTPRCAVIARYSSENPFESMFEVRVGLVSSPGSPDFIRVLFPLGTQTKHGARIVIEDLAPIQAWFHHCSEDGCVANFTRADTLRSLRSASKVRIQAINARGAEISPLFHTATFKSADDRKLVPLQKGGGTQDDQINYRIFLADTPPAKTAGDTTAILSSGVWQKSCDGPNCDVRMKTKWNDGKNSIGAYYFERETNGVKKQLIQVRFPFEFYLHKRPQLAFDNFAPIESNYNICLKQGGCDVIFDAGTGFLDAMKTSKEFVITAVTIQGNIWRITFPLGSFAKAYEGPAITPALIQQDDEKRTAAVKKLGYRLSRSNLPTTTLQVTKGPEPAL